MEARGNHDASIPLKRLSRCQRWAIRHQPRMEPPVLAGDAIPCNVNKPVVNGSAKFNDRFSVYENSVVGIAQPTLVQVILMA